MNEEKRVKGNQKNKLKNFSALYLAHHPLCENYRNHIFKIGSLYLCVGCTSIITAFIVYTILFFTIPSVFQGYPMINGIVAAIGVGISLLQFVIRPSNKIIKILFRFSLGLAVSAYIGIIVLIQQWGIKIGLFSMLFVGVILYNSLRREYALEECEKCSIKGTEPCDYSMDS